MKTKILKIIIALLLIFVIVMFTSQPVFADVPKKITTIFKDKNDKSNATNTVADTIGAVINAAQIIGMGVAIVMLIVIGIRYVYASPSGKAQLAKTTRIYVLGAVLLFCAAGLIGIIRRFVVKNIQQEGEKL